MNIRETIQLEIDWREHEIARHAIAAAEARAFVPPPWLEDVDVSTASFGGRPYVTITGELATVKSIQAATGALLRREVNSFDGAVTFCGEADGVVVRVCGNLPLAPTCRLEQYQETITRFKVVCEDPQAKE